MLNELRQNNFSTLLKAVSYPYAHNADDGFLPASKPDKGQPSLDPTTKSMNVFPYGKEGAHRISNTSESDMLIYLDCDTTSTADVAFYPHSEKVGVIIEGQPEAFFESANNVDYYKGE